ncbi:hypothetical protein [Methylocystis heyeri]|uniref:Uncharacterized protein n=1 Tax=Methylocystis heyeri TaxID=391905 RepID=A0A6B8KHP8_9HYPH|nr:hypothetical protein [Methylocystis heyeri]QGM46000.1 hypothetical protein H2LOC_009960 [Methylocystis heyeri]
MHKLIERVAELTSTDLAVARRAVGSVLLFLRDQAPQSRIGKLIDDSSAAHEAVMSALAASDGGLTTFMAASHSFQGEGRLDTLALEGKLKNLGLSRSQIDELMTEVFSHADALIGDEGLESLKRRHPDMERSLRYSSSIIE